MTAVCDMGLHERVYILVGVGRLRSARTGEWMRSNIPGVVISDLIIDRLRGAPQREQGREGKRICVEIIQEVREIPGVRGIHVMACRQEDMVAEILEEAGLLPRRWGGEPEHSAQKDEAKVQ